jgi:diguanylate cyclase (GGDEF)-like protein
MISRALRHSAVGRRLWLSVAVVFFLVGTGAAALAAHLVAQSHSSNARIAFNSTSAQITSTLRLAIQHEEDLVVGGRAFVSRNPHVSGPGFDEWAESNAALQRFPELQDIGLIVPVSGSQLAAFSARMLAHPILPPARQPPGSRASFQVLPQGVRANYCLAIAGVVRQRVAILPPGLDYCAVVPSLFAARDSGLSSYLPFQEGTMATLAVQTPVYMRHMPTATVAERRKAFVGWLAESLLPNVVLETALQGHPGAAVTFRYRSAISDVTFSHGRTSAGAHSVTSSLNNGWTVTTFGLIPQGGVLADGHALTLLAGGIAMCALFAMLMFVLATGRARAIELVREKTRELTYLSQHDSLTGLPNRALVMDRAEQMLARTRRETGLLGAALFLDLDGFKRVNDELGHAAGDGLLRIVAERLTSAVREEDTVGRLGGDEFIVLIASTTGEEGADRVADRILEALRQPIELEGHAAPVTVTASVGISIGQHATAGGLLRDADVALYTAKETGRDRYVLFDADYPTPLRRDVQTGVPTRQPVKSR